MEQAVVMWGSIQTWCVYRKTSDFAIAGVGPNPEFPKGDKHQSLGSLGTPSAP